MMTVQGTRKPVWRAFEQLMKAGTRRVNVTGFVSPADGASTVSVLATREDAPAPGTVGLQLFVANYHRLGDVATYACHQAQQQCVADPNGAYTDEALCNAHCGGGASARLPAAAGGRARTGGGAGALRNCPPANVTLTVKHAAGAAMPPTATARRIDSKHANPQQKWIGLGSPKYPTKAQLAAMDAASETAPEQVPLVRISDTESALSFSMEPYSTIHFAL
jgi:hypothetical protein